MGLRPDCTTKPELNGIMMNKTINGILKENPADLVHEEFQKVAEHLTKGIWDDLIDPGIENHPLPRTLISSERFHACASIIV